MKYLKPKLITCLILLLNVSIVNANSAKFEVYCANSDSKGESYLLEFEEQNNRSAKRKGKLTYMPKTILIGLEEFEVSPIVIDDNLECLIGQKKPVIVKCQSRREYLVDIPKAGISNDPREISATFEILHKSLKTVSMDGTHQRSWSYMRYALSHEQIGGIGAIVHPLIAQGESILEPGNFSLIRIMPDNFEFSGECVIREELQ